MLKSFLVSACLVVSSLFFTYNAEAAYYQNKDIIFEMPKDCVLVEPEKGFEMQAVNEMAKCTVKLAVIPNGSQPSKKEVEHAADVVAESFRKQGYSVPFARRIELGFHDGFRVLGKKDIGEVTSHVFEVGGFFHNNLYLLIYSFDDRSYNQNAFVHVMASGDSLRCKKESTVRYHR